MLIPEPSPAADPQPQPPSPSPSQPHAATEIIRDLRLHKPASWFERLNPEAMFGRSAPLEVELGSGDGSFLVNWAQHHPDRNFIGVERLLGRIRKLDRKTQRLGLNNLLGLRIEASYCLEFLLPPASVDALHVYFPDPWPKRRHHKNRLVNDRFPTIAAQALKPGAIAHLRTDNTEYFAQIVAVFNASPLFRPVDTPGDLASFTTDFERDFNAAGIPTQYASYVRT